MTSRSVLVFLLGSIYIARSATAQYYFTYDDLEATCGRTLVLACPYTSDGRAGTFRYRSIEILSKGFCYFHVTLNSNCMKPSTQFAFYFNIRKFRVPDGDALSIHENKDESRLLILSLYGVRGHLSNPASVAQTLTTYAKEPSVTFEYNRTSSLVYAVHEVIIDVVVVEDTSHSHNTYCGALQGYVNEDLICDADGISDRVNCPSSYTANPNGISPALWRQCDLEVQGSKNTGLSPLATGGIVIGIAILLFLILLAAVARRGSLSQSITATSTSTTVTGPPLIVTNHAPSPATPPSMDSPPSYADVMVAQAQSAIPLSHASIPRTVK
ncbi:uncharacterized protein LOC129596526 [Paramacrobiotus metropolitanus]|uniref:uncharacterized protein LOC129596526 n=1 Tax=Paramacrobiotus metropolitanus TaxID=2943436 RepID=UPI002445A808|nr:uncharacterized protein LOC129596526 [Paramacrobiotus metropolitanus]